MIFFNHKNKEAFTLVELSVVVTIISIMLTALIVSKSLINSVRVNKLYQEYKSMTSGMYQFYDQYGCFPGDCKLTQINDLSAQINSTCTTLTETTGNTHVYNVFNTNNIESATKRTCMFQELQAAGYVNGINLTYTSTSDAPLTDSVAGGTIPYAAFSRQAAWDFRSVVTMITMTDGSFYKQQAVDMYQVPAELGINDLGIGKAGWRGNHYLLLRDANLSLGLLNDISYATSQITNGPQYPISAILAQKIDTKFDDGKPYTGNIIGTLNLADWNTGYHTNTRGSCSTVSSVEESYPTVNSTAYLTSNDISRGCLVAFMVKSPSM